MRDRSHHTWTAWIAIAALLLSGMGPGLAFGHDRLSPFGDDVCSASRTGDRSASSDPAHAHKHCAQCVAGAALQFAAPQAEPTWTAQPPSRCSTKVFLQRLASASLIVGTSPRGPPGLI